MIPFNSVLFPNTASMEHLLLSMDSQIRFYLWTINEINAMRCAAELQRNAVTPRSQKRISHYKKRWRDRYISPDSRPVNDHSNDKLKMFWILSQIVDTIADPLQMMDRLVNNRQTYEHLLTFRQILWHIVDDNIPDII